MSASNFEDYLKSHTAPKGGEHTHTRIGDKELSIYGGSYQVSSEEWSNFMKKYYQHVFLNGKMEYLTEKQLIEDGPILVDIDLRYDTSIQKRQHTKDHIVDGIMVYAEALNKLVEVNEGSSIDVFVMEKKDVNIQDKQTKDGIHILMGLKMHKGLQVLLRERVMNEIKNMWSDLPITNEWSDVFDEGITKGFVNWQMYGSRKPGNQAYMLKYHFKLDYNDESWNITEHPLSSFSIEKNIEKLSARYNKHPEFPMLDKVKELFDEAKESLSQQGSKGKGKPKYRLKIASDITKLPYDQIPDEQTLDAMIEEMLAQLGPTNYRVKETHQYTMCLPKAYYGPGSYNKWIRVGWALANTHPKLFLSWLKMTSQDDCRNTLKGGNGKFDWRNVPELFETWNSFNSENPDGLTHRSIMYWAKTDAREKYNEIRKETIDFFIEQSIITTTEYDLALVLYNMYKDRFVCVSIEHNIWYEFINNRWFEIDSGNSLRSLISNNMFNLYMEKANENMAKVHSTSENQEAHEKEKKRGGKLAEICVYLKTTTKKNNIMREARELFYDKVFYEKKDSNPYLLAFNNYVIDFKDKIYRKGKYDDYISKCTNIDYVPYDEAKHGKTAQEIHKFMSEIFPNEDLRKYMWEHLASCLIGTLRNQTFHIYKGGGRNGKSKLVELMAKALGTYCHSAIPITLLTEKRSSIGKATPEMAELVGIRFGIMQEPSRGAQINEGFMKQITGGDPVQGRPLYKPMITFVPQCQLVVCTNYDFENTSKDDGTWRRLRYIDFQSKMLENPYENPKFPKKEFPYQFPVDKDINKKFETWAPVFISMLVDIAFKTDGNVKDCDVVLANSNKHREDQDVMAEFSRDVIITKAGSKVKKTEVLETFKQWFMTNYGKMNMPKGKEICEYMTTIYGDYKNGWHGIGINYDGEENENNDDTASECSN